MADVPAMLPQMVQAYKDATDNLIFLKKQQWQVTNYLFIAEAAIFILSREVGPNPRAFLEMLTIPTALIAVGVLWMMQWSMTKFRKRLAFIYENYFAKDQQEIMELHVTKDAFFEGSFITFVLTLAALAAGIFTFVIV